MPDRPAPTMSTSTCSGSISAIPLRALIIPTGRIELSLRGLLAVAAPPARAVAGLPRRGLVRLGATRQLPTVHEITRDGVLDTCSRTRTGQRLGLGMTAQGTTRTRFAIVATSLGTVLGVLSAPTQAGVTLPAPPALPAPPPVHVTPPPVPAVHVPAPSPPPVHVTLPAPPALPAPPPVHA